MKNFYCLKVLDIKFLTKDSVCIRLDTSNIDSTIFHFTSGQYITIKKNINNEDIRRSYSISSMPGDSIEIGVKLVRDGLMSTYLIKTLKAGDSLEVMPPVGSFILNTNSKHKKHYMAICAGSGITPILSMIRSVVSNEPESSFTLVYGNQNRSSIMFREELLQLEKEFQSQLLVYYAFSREEITNCIYGRINTKNLDDLFSENKNLKNVDNYFLCGPGEMIDDINNYLLDRRVAKESIYFERFTSAEISKKIKSNSDIKSNVSVCVDGDDFDFSLSSNGKSILDAAMEAGADVPFSCKGGVCCVCKAKLIEGTVSMDQNFSLSEDEVDQGFILTCQSHPTSENVIIDFDEI